MTPLVEPDDLHPPLLQDVRSPQDRCYAALYQEMIAWLALPVGAHVLDAGCGAGGLTGILAAAVGATGHVWAVDRDAAQVATIHAVLATTGYQDQVVVLPGDIIALPFAADTFDLVWCSHVLHGVPDALASARELRRVLKPGGRLALREDFAWRPQCLPDEAAVGIPGLEYRLNAVEVQGVQQWRRAQPDHTPYPFGWTQLLLDVGCHSVTAHTFVLELLPPFSALQVAFLRERLTGIGYHEETQRYLSPRDRATIAHLTDPQHPD
ncbi:MAG: class I SAM-dependent methyltransferase [Ktedonobacterales bacterium]|nr:class I SAM-dependent methyltransferase [Ktedonobacterales bacterium]